MSSTRRSATPVGRTLSFERGLVFLAGLLLALLGASALLVGLGSGGTFRAQRPILDPIAVHWIRDHPWIVVPTAMALGIVLCAFGLRWLARSLHPEPRPDFRPEARLTLTGPALTRAVRTDAETMTGVSQAKVRTAGTRRRHLRLTLSLEEDTDISHLRQELDDKVLSRARQALETDTVPTSIRLKLDRGPKQRVQ